ncbi:hypothetical protein N7462_008633 [Penicillium macrosclerotiorum]|uniref:uncharacterized protein n=1 Tax=Penicillium macrosclerotiorum TaxID=303699 RepID=UPI0025487854|nr:uncharacterized protein N7462_008633 [Penicillium macrosclerotiorum]KAJ5675736.1 hypothetical protein N7462_008633 [Penicillium macrosclerotiorum]
MDEDLDPVSQGAQETIQGYQIIAVDLNLVLSKAARAKYNEMTAQVDRSIVFTGGGLEFLLPPGSLGLDHGAPAMHRGPQQVLNIARVQRVGKDIQAHHAPSRIVPELALRLMLASQTSVFSFRGYFAPPSLVVTRHNVIFAQEGLHFQL